MTMARLNRPEAYAIAFVAALVIGAILAAGANPLEVVQAALQRALFTRAGFLEALLRAIPLTIMGLGIVLSFRAGVFNIGMDGQLIAGSALAVAMAPLLPGGAAGIALFLALGVVGGGVWGGIAGFMKARLGGNEIITTIMLTYIATQLLSWLVRGPMQETMRIIPRSDPIDAALRLPIIVDGTRIHLGLVIAILAVIVTAIVVGRSRYGFKLDVVGRNPGAAAYAGIDPVRIAGGVLAVSGAFAGLAGAVEISGLYGRLQEGFAPGFGISAIAVALVARLNPWLVPVSALGFSLMYAGLSSVAQKALVPFPLINIIEGAVVLVFLAVSVMQPRGQRPAGARSDG